MTLVQAEPKKIYIRVDQQGWQPGPYTVLYYDFEHTGGTAETDVAGNYNGIYRSTPTIGTLTSGKKYFRTGGNNYLYTNSQINTLNYNNATLCFWAKINDTGAHCYMGQERWGISGSNGTMYWEHLSNGNECFNLGAPYTVTSSGLSGWNNIILTSNGTKQYLYINGVYVNEGSNVSSTGTRYLYIGGAVTYNTAGQPTANLSNYGNADFGTMIIENKIWTATDIQDYYNLTKADYGL